MKFSKNTWIGLGVLILVVIGASVYLFTTKDSRAMNRMERQIGPLPEK